MDVVINNDEYYYRIADKRIQRVKENGDIIFSTSGYGGRFFNIPKWGLVTKVPTSIYLNEHSSEPAHDYVVTKKVHDYINEFVERMNDYHGYFIG